MNQQDAEAILSRLDDIEEHSQRISPESPQGREAGLALINGDLQLVRQQAVALPGEVGLRLQALCLYEEACIRLRFAESVQHKQIKDFTEATRLLERAIELGATEKMYYLLGSVYAELGRFEQARKALTAAAASGEGDIATAARENLLRLSKDERRAKNPWTKIMRILDKLEKDKADQRLHAVVEHKKALQEFFANKDITTLDRLNLAEANVKKTEGVISPKLGFVCLIICIIILIYDFLSPRFHSLMMLFFGLILGLCFLGAIFGVLQIVRRFMRKRG